MDTHTHSHTNEIAKIIPVLPYFHFLKIIQSCLLNEKREKLILPVTLLGRRKTIA